MAHLLGDVHAAAGEGHLERLAEDGVERLLHALAAGVRADGERGDVRQTQIFVLLVARLFDEVHVLQDVGHLLQHGGGLHDEHGNGQEGHDVRADHAPELVPQRLALGDVLSRAGDRLSGTVVDGLELVRVLDAGDAARLGGKGDGRSAAASAEAGEDSRRDGGGIHIPKHGKTRERARARRFDRSSPRAGGAIAERRRSRRSGRRRFPGEAGRARTSRGPRRWTWTARRRGGSATPSSPLPRVSRPTSSQTRARERCVADGTRMAAFCADDDSVIRSVRMVRLPSANARPIRTRAGFPTSAAEPSIDELMWWVRVRRGGFGPSRLAGKRFPTQRSQPRLADDPTLDGSIILGPNRITCRRPPSADLRGTRAGVRRPTVAPKTPRARP